MIEFYPYILDYSITPSLPIPPLVSTGAVVDSEGTLIRTFIPPTPVPQKDEVNGQTTGRPGVSGHRKVKADNGKGAEEGNLETKSCWQ